MSRQINPKKPFLVAVREKVREIPSGSVLSYGEVALRAGYPGAARAVGSLMKKNWDDTIPCHRVIRSDGRCGAYNRGGEEEKAKRLESEGVLLEKRSSSGKTVWYVRNYGI